MSQNKFQAQLRIIKNTIVSMRSIRILRSSVLKTDWKEDYAEIAVGSMVLLKVPRNQLDKETFNDISLIITEEVCDMTQRVVSRLRELALKRGLRFVQIELNKGD